MAVLGIALLVGAAGKPRPHKERRAAFALAVSRHVLRSKVTVSSMSGYLSILMASRDYRRDRCGRWKGEGKAW